MGRFVTVWFWMLAEGERQCCECFLECVGLTVAQFENVWMRCARYGRAGQGGKRSHGSQLCEIEQAQVYVSPYMSAFPARLGDTFASIVESNSAFRK